MVTKGCKRLTCSAKVIETHAQRGGPPKTNNVSVLNTIAFRCLHRLMQGDPQVVMALWQQDEVKGMSKPHHAGHSYSSVYICWGPWAAGQAHLCCCNLYMIS